MKPTTRDDFELWLAHMDDAIEQFVRGLPEETRVRLDYGPASLDALEEWLLERFSAPPALEPPGASRTADGAARYVGETFRRRLGGRWDIELEDPEYVFFGRPQLVDLSERDTPICPLALVTTAVSRGEGDLLRGILERRLQERA